LPRDGCTSEALTYSLSAFANRKLIIHEADAERVRSIFKRFVQLKSATLLARELVAARATNRYGHLLD
jgi:hypothetical protein